MRPIVHFFAVAPRGRPEDFAWVTTFVFEPTCNLYMAEPSNKYCDPDIVNFEFKVLTWAEYETHIAFGSLDYRDSDDFALYVTKHDMHLCMQAQSEAAIYNDVFDQ